MKKNNKGFTVVEMGISFCLIFTVSILLFQIILTVKDVYIKSNIETTLLSRQGMLLNRIYKDFEDKLVTSVSLSGDVFTFTFQDQTTSSLSIDKQNKKITYDGYTWKLDSSTSIESYTHQLQKQIDNKKYFNIQVIIKNTLTDDKNYGIQLVFPLTE